MGFRVSNLKFWVQGFKNLGCCRFAELSRAGVRAAPQKCLGGLPHPGARLRSWNIHPYRPRLFSFWGFRGPSWVEVRLRFHSAINAEAHCTVRLGCQSRQVREMSRPRRSSVQVYDSIDIKKDFDGVPQQYPREGSNGRSAGVGRRSDGGSDEPWSRNLRK